MLVLFCQPSVERYNVNKQGQENIDVTGDQFLVNDKQMTRIFAEDALEVNYD